MSAYPSPVAPSAQRRFAAGGQHYPAPRLSRGNLVWRYVLATIGYPLSVAVMIDNVLSRDLPWIYLIGDLVAFGAAVFVIRYRRRWPRAVAAGLMFLAIFFSGPRIFALWAYVSLCTRRRWREVIGFGLAGVAVATVNFVMFLDGTGLTQRTWADWLIVASLLTPVVIIGAALGVFTGAQRDSDSAIADRSDFIVAEREQRIEQGRAAERNRIAREMHDVLAHRLSLVSMHAGILAYRSDLPVEQKRELAQLIVDNADASLVELGGVLGELRPDANPDLTKLPELIAQLKGMGQDVRFAGASADLTGIGLVTSRNAYRIIQEALTNARKHAPGAPVTLRLAGGPGQGLRIVVQNPLTSAGVVPGAGVGLVGMRERAQVAGGRVTVRQSDDDFTLEGWLPW